MRIGSTSAPTSGIELDVTGDVQASGVVTAAMYRMTAGAALTTTASLTQATLQAASVWQVDTTAGAFTATLFSDVADNGLAAADIGRTFRFVKINTGTNALTVALDADLTLITRTAMAAGGLTLEDQGDYLECFVATTDLVVCTTYEAD